MGEELKKYLYQQISCLKGLSAIIISDRDGVPIIKVTSDQAPEFALRSSYLSNFPLASDLCGKLGFGNCEYLVCNYENHTIVHFDRHPLTISFVATNTTNIGLILNLEVDIYPTLESLGGIAVDQDK